MRVVRHKVSGVAVSSEQQLKARPCDVSKGIGLGASLALMSVSHKGKAENDRLAVSRPVQD